MIATALCLIAIAAHPQHGADQITFRHGGRKPHPAFHRGTDTLKTAYLNGVRTKLVMPEPYTLTVHGNNARGRIAGTFFYSYGDLVWTSVPVGFTTARGRIDVLPFEGYAINSDGVVIGIKRPGDDPGMDKDGYSDAVEQAHVWIWQKGKATDIGLGYDVRFNNGTIEGYYVCDSAGKSIEPVAAKLQFGTLVHLTFRTFTFVHGIRHEARTLLTKAPFKGIGYSDWLDNSVG